MDTIDHKPAGKLKALEAAMARFLYERDEVIRGVLLALISAAHVFMIGPPGGGKTFAADLICAAISGARLFKKLLTRYSQMEDVWGPVRLSALEQDRYERNTDGMLADAEIAVVDEIWKCNASLLNSFLEAFNERRYNDGAGTRRLPLITAIAASNELPESEELEALYDRIMLRFNVQRIHDPANLREVLTRTDLDAENIGTIMSLDDLRTAQTEAAKVAVPDSVIDTILQVKAKLEAEGIVASDRRWRGAVKVLKANAYMEGRDEVTVDDLEVLSNVMWRDPSEEDKVRDVVAKVANPEWSRMLEKYDAAKDLLDNLPAPGEESYLLAVVDAQGQIGKLLEEADVIRHRTDSQRVQNTFDRIVGVARDLEAASRSAAGSHDYKKFLGGK